MLGVEGVLRDITDRKMAEEALRDQMRRDPLTGVLNHAAIVSELREIVSGADNGAYCAVLMNDVDGLKAINDTFGHPVGDSVLVDRRQFPLERRRSRRTLRRRRVHRRPPGCRSRAKRKRTGRKCSTR